MDEKRWEDLWPFLPSLASWLCCSLRTATVLRTGTGVLGRFAKTNVSDDGDLLGPLSESGRGCVLCENAFGATRDPDAAMEDYLAALSSAAQF
jgi:hypothetical protein